MIDYKYCYTRLSKKTIHICVYFTKVHIFGVEMYSEKIKQIRSTLNLSIAKLADKINVPARTITSYERGERTPSLEFLTQMCINLDLNPAFFLLDKGPMFNEICENTHIFKKNETPVQNLSQWGVRLAQLLADNEETPYAFSKRTGISERRIEKFIIDSAEPTLQELTAIKCNVDICTDELLYGQTVEKNTTADVSLSRDEILKLKKLLSD